MTHHSTTHAPGASHRSTAVSSLPDATTDVSPFAHDPLLLLVAGFLGLTGRRNARDERGLSQSTENAILLAGAVTIAGIVVSMITIFVKSRLPR